MKENNTLISKAIHLPEHAYSYVCWDDTFPQGRHVSGPFQIDLSIAL